MIYNQSLKEFIKSFLKDIQKQGNIESSELFSPKKNQNNEINLSRFKSIIEIILKLFWRLVSNNTRTKDSQEDNDQFTESYLGDLIFKGYSIENFIDLVYVYGRSNSSVVQNILARLGELSPDKLISQFNDSLTSSLRVLKNHVKAFCTLAKSFYDPSGLTNTDDWPDRIKFCLEDSIREMNDIYLFAKHFPNIVSPTVWSSDILIILSNYYMLIKEHKSSIWEFHFLNKISLELLTTHLKKLIYKSIVTLLRKHYFGIIGNWGNNFAKKQSELAKSITHFILQMTGNEVIHKDSVPSNNSVIEKNGGCQSFFKKILKSIEFEPYFFQLEDCVMQNRELLTNILSSVYPHEERNNAELEMAKRLSRKQSKAESSRKQQVIPESSSGLNRKMKELENYVPSNTSYLDKDDGESLKINYDDDMPSFKRNYDEEVEEFSLKIDNDAQKLHSNAFEQEETISTSKPQDNKTIENIDPQFLIKSEQDKIERKKKKKKLKNLWKDHVTVLKQMEAEKQKEFDEVKRKTLWLAENIEYEDEFDDIALEKQTSKASVDVSLQEFTNESTSKKEADYIPARGPKAQKQNIVRGKGQKKEERKKPVLTDFNSYKASIRVDSKPAKLKSDTDCWIDSEPVARNNRNQPVEEEEEDEPNEKDEQSRSDRDGNNASDQRGRGRGRGRARGRGGYKYTQEERSDRDKLKAGREIQTRKKGGHHDHKDKAAKKRQY